MVVAKKLLLMNSSQICLFTTICDYFNKIFFNLEC